MSKFKPIRCLESSIPEEISDGALYITTDTEQLFVDTDSKRLAIKDVITVEDEASLPLAPVKGKLYVALSEKSLWTFTTEWVQIGSGSGGGGYVLPVASKDTLGGVKIDGTSIIISDDGTISSINKESESTKIAGIAPVYTYDTGYAATVYGEYTYSNANYYYIVGNTATVPWTYDNYNTAINFKFGTIDTVTNQFKPDLDKYAYTIRNFKNGDALNNSNGIRPGGSGVTNGSYFRYIIGTLNSDGTFIPKIIVADPTSGSNRYDTYYTFYHIDDYTIQENTSGDIEITPTSTTVINQVNFWTGSTGVAANGINFYENADGSITFGVWNSSNERYVTSNPRNSINFNSLNLNCVFYRCNMTSEVPTNTISLSTNINITDADNNVVWTPGMTEKTTKILLKFTDNFINQDGVLDVNTNVTIQGNEFNNANQLVQLDESGKLPAIDGSQLTNLPGNTGYTKSEVDILLSEKQDKFIPVSPLIFTNYEWTAGEFVHTIGEDGVYFYEQSYADGTPNMYYGGSTTLTLQGGGVDGIPNKIDTNKLLVIPYTVSDYTSTNKYSATVVCATPTLGSNNRRIENCVFGYLDSNNIFTPVFTTYFGDTSNGALGIKSTGFSVNDTGEITYTGVQRISLNSEYTGVGANVGVGARVSIIEGAYHIRIYRVTVENTIISATSAYNTGVDAASNPINCVIPGYYYSGNLGNTYVYPVDKFGLFDMNETADFSKQVWAVTTSESDTFLDIQIDEQTLKIDENNQLSVNTDSFATKEDLMNKLDITKCTDIPVGLEHSISDGVLSVQTGYVKSAKGQLEVTEPLTTADISNVQTGADNGVILGDVTTQRTLEISEKTGKYLFFAGTEDNKQNDMVENNRGSWIFASSSQGTNSTTWPYYGFIFNEEQPVGKYTVTINIPKGYITLFLAKGSIGNLTNVYNSGITSAGEKTFEIEAS